MRPKLNGHYTAFADFKKVASGEIMDVALKVKKYLAKETKAQILIFDDVSGGPIDIDFRGAAENMVRRLEAVLAVDVPAEVLKKTGPGRPKLGVTAKEVTLLPDHWEWLARQPGGASVTLRKLVDEAKKKNFAKDQARMAQDATYKFITVIAGDLPHYEEALRALYANENKKFEKQIAAWPKDIQDHAVKLAKNSWK